MPWTNMKYQICLSQFSLLSCGFDIFNLVVDTSQLDQLFCRTKASEESFGPLEINENSVTAFGGAKTSSAVFSNYTCGYRLSICREAETGSATFSGLIQHLRFCNTASQRNLHGVSPKKNQRGTPEMQYKTEKAYISSAKIGSRIMGSLFLCWVSHIIDTYHTYQLGSNLMIKYQHFKILAMREF